MIYYAPQAAFGLHLGGKSHATAISAEVHQTLTDLDLLVLGASHYYEGIELWKRSVMDIMTALQLIREVSPAQAILTHLSHTVDYQDVSPQLPPSIRLAYDGLIVEVQE